MTAFRVSIKTESEASHSARPFGFNLFTPISPLSRPSLYTSNYPKVWCHCVEQKQERSAPHSAQLHSYQQTSQFYLHLPSSKSACCALWLVMTSVFSNEGPFVRCVLAEVQLHGARFCLFAQVIRGEMQTGEHTDYNNEPWNEREINWTPIKKRLTEMDYPSLFDCF